MSTKASVGVVLLLASLASACSSTRTLPDRLSTAKEAFPDTQSMIPPPAMQGAAKEATFQASFEDVYRATVMSASQAMFNVTEENKHAGYVLAERNPQDNRSLHFFYALRIDELGGKETRVTIVAKAQLQCTYVKNMSALNFATLGIGGAVTAGAQQICRENSEVHWSDGNRQIDDRAWNKESTIPEMTQIITFIRNNLYATGRY